MIKRVDIIEGLINMRCEGLKPEQKANMMAKFDAKYTNDTLCELYFFATKCHIRQIFSNQFISLT
jgi:hypothetical protein